MFRTGFLRHQLRYFLSLTNNGAPLVNAAGFESSSSYPVPVLVVNLKKYNSSSREENAKHSPSSYYEDSRSHKENFSEGFLSFLSTLFILGFIGIKEVFCEKSESIKVPQIKEESSRESKTNENAKPEQKVTEDETDNKTGKNANMETKDLEKDPEKMFPTLPKEEKKCNLITLKQAVECSKTHLNRQIVETGAPGFVVAVSIDGKNVWTEGLGHSDIENSVRMSSNTVLRIASISKPLTMVAVSQLVEEGKLDLDAPIQKYVPSFPTKTYNGEKVTITTRHILSHTSGIRHYQLKEEVKSNCKEKKKDIPSDNQTIQIKENFTVKEKTFEEKLKEKRERLRRIVSEKAFSQKKEEDEYDEFSLEEYYIKEEFENVREALQLFQDDDLLFEPGNGYNYSTHGWTLVSAIIEGASGKSFVKVMAKLIKDLGFTSTYFDKNDQIIYRRSRFYRRDRHGKLKNAPYVNNSYKWAGGGFLSTVLDLNWFGNSMLYSYQYDEEARSKGMGKPGFLKASTMREMWTPVEGTKRNPSDEIAYGLGWCVAEREKYPKAFCSRRNFYTYHTGGAVGASSCLLILPLPLCKDCQADDDVDLPRGIVVSIITNLENVGLRDVALSIAKLFERVHSETSVLGAIAGSSKNKVYSLNAS